MWIPRNTDEIESAVRSATLVETSSFDGKQALPTSAKRNADLAIDAAAMSTDGGVLLYGIGEDEQERLTRLTPIPLAGAADRVGQIVATSINEVPHIELREYPTSADPSVGYLLVIVPASARAPHQVTVGGDLRYYGRGAKGNRRLTEGEVARLYERRQRWTVDADSELWTVVAHSLVPTDLAPGHLHAMARPVAAAPDLFERAMHGLGGPTEVHQRILQRIGSTSLVGKYGPSLERAGYWRRRGAEEWQLSTHIEDDDFQAPNIAKSLVTLSVNLDGRGGLYCGRATDSRLRDGNTNPLIIEMVIAGNVEVFFSVMGLIYEAAGYHGHVDVGVALTGLQGAGSVVREKDWRTAGEFSYSADRFSRTARVAAAELQSPADLAHRLLRSFYEATTGIEGYSPFIDA